MGKSEVLRSCAECACAKQLAPESWVCLNLASVIDAETRDKWLHDGGPTVESDFVMVDGKWRLSHSGKPDYFHPCRCAVRKSDDKPWAYDLFAMADMEAKE